MENGNIATTHAIHLKQKENTMFLIFDLYHGDIRFHGVFDTVPLAMEYVENVMQLTNLEWSDPSMTVDGAFSAHRLGIIITIQPIPHNPVTSHFE